MASKAALEKEIREELMKGDDPMPDEERDILQDGLEADNM